MQCHTGWFALQTLGLFPRLAVVSALGLTILGAVPLQLAGILQLVPYHDTAQCFRFIH